VAQHAARLVGSASRLQMSHFKLIQCDARPRWSHISCRRTPG
jgi:hypothetical protein